MKRTFFYMIGLIILLSSCDPSAKYSEDIIGKWICTEIRQNDTANILTIPTNEAFVLEFNSGGSEIYSQGYTLPDGGGSAWMKESSYTYKIEKDILSVSGYNSFGEQFNMSATITQLSSVFLNYQENSRVINGVNSSSERTFYLYKANDQYDHVFTGEWEGELIDIEISTNPIPVKYHFKSDYSFDIYEKINEEWTLSSKTGNYQINGDLLSLNFTDHSAETPNQSYRCWLVTSFTNNVMILKNWSSTNNHIGLQGKQLTITKL